MSVTASFIYLFILSGCVDFILPACANLRQLVHVKFIECDVHSGVIHLGFRVDGYLSRVIFFQG